MTLQHYACLRKLDKIELTFLKPYCSVFLAHVQAR